MISVYSGKTTYLCDSGTFPTAAGKPVINILLLLITATVLFQWASEEELTKNDRMAKGEGPKSEQRYGR